MNNGNGTAALGYTNYLKKIGGNMDKHKQLADLILAYIASRRDKKEESFYKDKPKKNKQGQVTNGALNIRLAIIINRLYPEKKEAVKSIEKSKKTSSKRR